MEPIDYAREYVSRGWLPIPLMPGSKRPALKFKHMEDTALLPGLDYERPWRMDPERGVAILLKPSNLLIVDCDSKEAFVEATVMTPEAPSNAVETRSGYHLYYARPDDCPPLRTVQRGSSGKIDILAAGFVVAPGSTHPSGFVYRWVAKGPLQEAPNWAVGMLQALRTRTAVLNSSLTPESVMSAKDISLLRLNAVNPKCCDWAYGFTTPKDRSRALWLTINTCIRLKYDDAAIAKLVWYGALQEKPRAQGWDWLCGELARARLELLPD